MTATAHFCGDTVAVVVADDLYRAADAADAVDVTYDELPVVLDARQASTDDAPLVHADVPTNTADCGTCVVLLNGRVVKSCNVLAVQADGATVSTIEGLSQNGQRHPI